MAADQDRAELLKQFQGLRVTDVCDGMDGVGLQDVGLMDRSIGPLWRDIDGFAHRIYGIAHTVRFVPTGRRAPVFESVEQHLAWKNQWYSELARGPMPDQICAGDVIVIDGAGVIVVPRDKAMQVAAIAREVQEDDKAGRRKLYEKLGFPTDFTVDPT